MSENPDIRRLILTTFKLCGYTIRSGCSDFLVDELGQIPPDDRQKLLDDMCDHVQRQGLSVPVVEKHHLELAFRESQNYGLNESETVFSVIPDAFSIPSFVYDCERKKFIQDTKERNLLGDAGAKGECLRNRYYMLWQRTARHEMFSKGLLDKNDQGFVLRRVENILSTSKLKDVVVLGMFTKFADGKFHVEDPTGKILLDISDAKMHSGFFCDGCFVLVQGKYNEGVLKVSSLGFPPPEAATSSRAYFGTANTWGGKSKTLLKYSQRLKTVELTDTEATIIFLSDCWLDDAVVMNKLRVLFEGYDDSPPVAIVLMGPFSRTSIHYRYLSEKFSELGGIIAQCPSILEKTDIVLVPAVDDPPSSNILPRPALLDFLIADLRRKVPRVVATTNPCRLQYCTQQITIFRMDLVTKLCRNTIKFPDTGNLEEHIARTLVCQGTLAPMHMNVMPIYWQYDAALSLYPLPDLIVLGDSTKSFTTDLQGCTILNVGSFSKSNFSFKVYVPHNRTVEDSMIPTDEAEMEEP
ncbi:DNA polymerase epsilon subunit 2 [Lutzomyia longipalpis]|uniref:DNA polymerase epsilon subunit n=1 Tax=Lutzomyia longipalpis TaxID=7200 RepID=A0A1B0CS94_LUTLO|nr:DNA polymerase epsilon subunit 2 [Lutzomyia longipalpis]